MTRRQYTGVVGFYALLALIMLHQPLIHAPGYVPGAEITDAYHFHWNYWWMRHALSEGMNLYLTDYVMAPYTANLAYHTLTPFWFPVWALLEPLTGTVHAMNAIFALALTLNGGVFFAFLRVEGVTPGLALVGGVLVMLAPVTFTAVYWTNINLLNWFWLPGIVLVWRQIVLTRGLRWTITLGLMLWAMLLCDLQYAIFGLFFVVPYGLWTLWHSAGRGRLVLLGAGAVTVALVLVWVAGPLPYLNDLNRAGLAPTPAERAYAVRFPQAWVWNLDPNGGMVSLGAVILPLALIAVVAGWRVRTSEVRAPLTPPRGFWLLVALPPLIFTAGTQIPLFYAAFHDLFGGMFRYPERLTMLVIMALAAFALRTLSPSVQKRRVWRYALPVVLVLLVSADARLYHSLPVIALPPTYDLYTQIGAEPHDYVIVEVPTGASSGEGIVGSKRYSRLQFYGITHGKRMVNGHVSRAPIAHYWYLRTDDPLFAWLGGRRLLEPTAAEARLASIIPAYPVGYVMVHTDLIERATTQKTVQEVTGYLNSLNAHLCPPMIEGALLAYRTTWHPAGCDPRTPPEIEPGVYRIDIGAASDRAYIGWGWYFRESIVPGFEVRWMGAPHATTPGATEAYLYADLPLGAYTLRFAAQAFEVAQDVTVRVDGAPVGTVTVQPNGVQELTMNIPAAVIGDGVHKTITFDHDRVIDAGSRDLALLVDWVAFELAD